MNDRKKLPAILALSALVFLLAACQTTGRAVVPNHGIGAGEARSDIADLGDGQTDLALTGDDIEDGSGKIAGDLGDLESAIEGRTDENAVLEAIFREIRKRSLAEIQ